MPMVGLRIGQLPFVSDAISPTATAAAGRTTATRLTTRASARTTEPDKPRQARPAAAHPVPPSTDVIKGTTASMIGSAAHWDSVYRGKSSAAVSWYQER